MFVMIERMNKKYKFMICIALTVCVAIVAFAVGVKTSQDDIAFEFSYIDKGLNAEYFALKQDNTLVWKYGKGINSDYTFGSYFSQWHIDDEKEVVSISKEDAKELKKSIRKTKKGLKTLSSNPIKSKKGGQAIFFKYKNKYYNMEYPKKDDDNLKAQQNMDNLRNVCKACVDKYLTKAEIIR